MSNKEFNDIRLLIIENELKDFQYLSDSAESFLEEIEDFQITLEDRFTVEKRNSFSLQLRQRFKTSSQELESLKRFIEEKQISFYQRRLKRLEDEIQLIKSSSEEDLSNDSQSIKK